MVGVGTEELKRETKSAWTDFLLGSVGVSSLFYLFQGASQRQENLKKGNSMSMKNKGRKR